MSSELDVTHRIRDLPRSAMVRGIFFWTLKEEADRRGLLAVRDLAEMLRKKDAWRLYPASDLMTAYATAATLVDRDPNEGLRILFASMPTLYARTWYGEIFRRLLVDDPLRALRYVERARERTANYGSWRLERVGPCHAVLHMIDEYFWIESAQRGGCEGLLDLCRVDGEVHAELDGPYRGALDITWRKRTLLTPLR